MSQMNVLAIFRDGSSAARAALAARTQGLGEVVTFSPTPDRAILGALRRDVSPVRLFTLVGAVVGCLLGVALPAYTMLDWPLITGGKPTISIPPLVVISFAVTMLLGALGAVAGFLLLSGLPTLTPPASYDARFSEDRFGVLVTCENDKIGVTRACLHESGADTVRSVSTNIGY